VGRVNNASIHRANLNTFGGFKPANTFGAFGRINNVDFFTLSYGLILAFWFAGTTTNALLSDFVCHFIITSLNF